MYLDVPLYMLPLVYHQLSRTHLALIQCAVIQSANIMYVYVEPCLKSASKWSSRVQSSCMCVVIQSANNQQAMRGSIV